MGFRVLFAGPRHFTDYPTLRAALDVLLVNRLPDVELLTVGGPGVPILAASYAAAHGSRSRHGSRTSGGSRSMLLNGETRS
jgi:hypothetical protein